MLKYGKVPTEWLGKILYHIVSKKSRLFYKFFYINIFTYKRMFISKYLYIKIPVYKNMYV